MLRSPSWSKLLSVVGSVAMLGACAPIRTGDPSAEGRDPHAGHAPEWRGVEPAEAAMLMPLPRTGVVPLVCEERPARSEVQRYHPGRALVLRVYEHQLVIPARALDTVAEFRLHAPEAPRAEILVQPLGAFAGFNGRAPATLIMGYRHCEAPDRNRSLRIRRYRVDGPEFGEDLGGEVNPRARTIRIRRDDLSGYTIVQI